MILYGDAYDRTRAGLDPVASDAERLKTHRMVENVWNRILMTPLEMRSLIDGVSSEYVNVLFDTGIVVLFGYPEQWIRLLGERVKEVHFKDFRPSVGTLAGFVQLLEGDVNWPEVRASLN